MCDYLIVDVLWNIYSLRTCMQRKPRIDLVIFTCQLHILMIIEIGTTVNRYMWDGFMMIIMADSLVYPCIETLIGHLPRIRQVLIATCIITSFHMHFMLHMYDHVSHVITLAFVALLVPLCFLHVLIALLAHFVTLVAMLA